MKQRSPQGNKIENLIKQHCPDGVEFKMLREVAEIGTGKSNRQDAQENGEYPFYVRSKGIQRINSFEFDEEAIIIPGEGGIGDIFHYANGKYALHQRAYRICFVVNEINTKFAYYYLISAFKQFIFMKAVNATVSSIRKPMIEDFPIPIAPLAIQREIVNILDKFTELEAELEARKRQYEYYRCKLLTFNQTRGEIKWFTMNEIGSFYGGLTGKSKNDFSEGNAKFVTYMNVFSNIAINTESNDFVKISADERQNKVGFGDIIFTGSSETPEECGMSSVM